MLSVSGLASASASFLLEHTRLGRHREEWRHGSILLAWTTIFIHGCYAAASRSSVKLYRIGIWLLVSSTAVSVLSFSRFPPGSASFSNISYPVVGAWILNSASSVALAILSISISRGRDVTVRGRPVDRERVVSVLSRFTWAWVEPLLLQASSKNDLHQDDVNYPDYMLQSHHLYDDWKGTAGHDTLLVNLMYQYRVLFGVSWLFTGLRCLVSMLPFLTLSKTLDLLQHRLTGGPVDLILISLILRISLFNLLDAWMDGCLYWFSLSRLALPIRAQLTALVFGKSLRLKDIASAQTRTFDGESGNDQDPEDSADPTDPKQYPEKQSERVANLIGVDAERITYFFQYQFYIIYAILKLSLFSVYLAKTIGALPVIAGLTAWLVTTMAGTWISKLLATQSKTLMRLRDAKTSLLSELLMGIRQIKLSALEARWEERLLASRKVELGALWKCFITDSAIAGCWRLGNILMATTTLAVYVIINGTLSASVAFVSTAMLGSLQNTLEIVPELIALGVDTLVSIARIAEYLRQPEFEAMSRGGQCIRFQGASIVWCIERKQLTGTQFTLQDLDIEFPREQFTVVLGKTGSGKSLLLSAILGEAQLLRGTISIPAAASSPACDPLVPEDQWIVKGSVAYVSQTPWLYAGSLKHNILFGTPFNHKRYDEVIRACALHIDLETLPDGDDTELGRSGVNLSGGQKWRITLARAVYSRAEILVLEDIFSAVDTKVSRWILENCINGALCEGRTRILATHSARLVLSSAEYVVELERGKASCFVPKRREVFEHVTDAVTDDDEAGQVRFPRTESAVKFIPDETREIGTVSKRVYFSYLNRCGGVFLCVICLVLFCAYQALILGKFQDNAVITARQEYVSCFRISALESRAWWIRIWTSDHDSSRRPYHPAIHQSVLHIYPESSSDYTKLIPPHPNANLYFYLGIYVTISASIAILGIVRDFWIYHLSVKASKTVFSDLLSKVLYAPLQWLDSVPTGRIMNRFTADMNILDQRVPLNWTLFVANVLKLLGICVASFSACAYLVAPAVPFVLAGLYLGARYMNASRPLKRMESLARSPVFELFDTVSEGIKVIRASRNTHVYMEQMHELIDRWTMTTFYTWLVNRWMSFRMAVIAAAFCLAVGLAVTFDTSIDAALAGLMLSLVLDFSESMGWVVRSYGELELDMSSMERLHEYMNIETESTAGKIPPASWPAHGKMEIRELAVGYGSQTPPVLREVSFTVEDRARVAIVGRTGAGKSSLAPALLGCAEIRAGNITIDGHDISTLALHHLRSRISFISQDPILFSGTLRSNLDPSNTHTDPELHAALAKLQLTSSPTLTHHTIDFSNLLTPISKAGSNLSHGQKQLISIARTVLASPKIIILDEATSAVDAATDALVQRSIRSSFPNSTLVVIAHRLSTIIDFDKIVVLEQGRLEECGTPVELWERDGLFRALCKNGIRMEGGRLIAV
ncbi:unnamed protein product [Periconia digitata]|uniref:Uncharacterized protein n=1 Tax=Periconia digitata TaxID=1303443 RepID=A0A9W4XVU9_9PLEO|nr:unnamed protein product [Periconia digitata]